MGQKVNPISFRLPVKRDWSSSWYVNNKNYHKVLFLDFKIRELIKSYYSNAIISKIIINRTNCDHSLSAIKPIDFMLMDKNTLINSKKDNLIGSANIIMHVQNIGSITGKNAKNLNVLKEKIKHIGFFNDVKIDVVDVKRPDIDANCIALNIANQLKKRASFKKVVKHVLDSAMRYDNCKGIKIIFSGRLGGAEMAKTEVFKNGSVPLHTIDANVNYGFAESFTIYGVIGIKVYIYLV